MADVGKIAVQERYGAVGRGLRASVHRPRRTTILTPGSKPTTSTTSTQSSPSKNNYTNSRPSVRPSPRSTNTAVRTLRSATRPKPGEPSLTMPPSTPAEQSLSRSTTDESVVRLHPLALGAYDLGLLYLRSQSALTPIIMYAIQVYRRYPPHNWNQ